MFAMLFALFSTDATAQTLDPNGWWTYLNQEILSSDTIPSAVNGLGAPSVQYWVPQPPLQPKFAVAADTQVGSETVDCPLGSWEIWFFTSPTTSGTNWVKTPAKIGVNATLERPCGARDPGFVIEDDGDWGLVYNLLEIDDEDNHAGWATKIGNTWSAGATDANLDGLVNMTLFKINDVWQVQGVNDMTGELMMATSSDLVNWTVPVVINDAATDWRSNAPDFTWGMNYLLTSPSTLCLDGGPPGWSWETMILGENLNGEMEFGLIVWDPARGWLASTITEYTWTTYGNDTWRNLDHITDNHRDDIFYEDVDAVTGKRKIGVITNEPTDVLDTSALHNRDCVQ